ncbi:MAG: ferritin-like domain-containing protein [Gemmatimonadetes bacterium]|nr:ferritin-like domain-containing protein [Gemmatimonadota bacterium]
MLASCSDDDDGPAGPDPMAPEGVVTLDLSSDTGVLNLAYALEQLEAAFYTRVVDGFPGSNLSGPEQEALTDIRNHEVIHRDFLAAVLGSARIPNLALDFGSVDFADRVSVLSTARALEDGGVAAYNGAGKLLSDVDNLLVAGKIVSVEARHAAAVRDLLRPGTRDFAGDDVVNPAGLDQATEPGFVIEGNLEFIMTPIRVVS